MKIKIEIIIESHKELREDDSTLLDDAEAFFVDAVKKEFVEADEEVLSCIITEIKED